MDIKSLIAECTSYDYKVMLEENKPKSWLKSVSAFSNGSGGSIFYGVNNEGVVIGLDDIHHVCEVISSAIRDHMDPLPDVELIPHDVDGSHILQLIVNKGYYSPYRVRRLDRTNFKNLATFATWKQGNNSKE